MDMDMKTIKITGASQEIQFNGEGMCEAWYVCHKCGEGFAFSDLCEKEKDAREKSDSLFDIQQTRYCYRCGYKLTSWEPYPESDYICGLNEIIEELEAEVGKLKKALKIIRRDSFIDYETEKEIAGVLNIRPENEEGKQMSDELKPCPFCGGKAVMRKWVNRNRYYISCENIGCDVHTETGHRDSKEEAIAAWNRRTEVNNAGQ